MKVNHDDLEDGLYYIMSHWPTYHLIVWRIVFCRFLNALHRMLEGPNNIVPELRLLLSSVKEKEKDKRIKKKKDNKV